MALGDIAERQMRDQLNDYKKLLNWIRNAYRWFKKFFHLEGPLDKLEKQIKEYKQIHLDIVEKVKNDGRTPEIMKTGPLTEKECQEIVADLRADGIEVAIQCEETSDMFGFDKTKTYKIDQKTMDKLNSLENEIETISKQRKDMYSKLNAAKGDEKLEEKIRTEMQALDYKERTTKLKFSKLAKVAYGKRDSRQSFYVVVNKSKQSFANNIFKKIQEKRSPDLAKGLIEEMNDFTIACKETDIFEKETMTQADLQKCAVEHLNKDRVFEEIRSGTSGMEMFDRKFSLGTISPKDLQKNGNNYFITQLSGKEIEELIKSRQLDDPDFDYCIMRGEAEYNPRNIDISKIKQSDIHKELDGGNGLYNVLVPIGKDKALSDMHKFMRVYSNTKHGMKMDFQKKRHGGNVYGKPIYTVIDGELRNPLSENGELALVKLSDHKDISADDFYKFKGTLVIGEDNELRMRVEDYITEDGQSIRKGIDLDRITKSITEIENARIYEEDQIRAQNKVQTIMNRSNEVQPAMGDYEQNEPGKEEIVLNLDEKIEVQEQINEEVVELETKKTKTVKPFEDVENEITETVETESRFTGMDMSDFME